VTKVQSYKKITAPNHNTTHTWHGSLYYGRREDCETNQWPACYIPCKASALSWVWPEPSVCVRCFECRDLF